MLTFLHVENVALIKQLDIDFSDGFTVLTGETGSGKSMVIDSINMVLGHKVPKDIIRHGENECYVYAIFDGISSHIEQMLKDDGITLDEDGTIMLSRRYNSDGKSVFKINNRTVPVFLLKTVAARLISVNEQHDSYSLLNDDVHIDYLDSYTESFVNFHKETLNEYKQLFNEYNIAKKKLSDLVSNSKDRESRLEFLKFQKNEISSAKLQQGEEQELLIQKEQIKNSERIVKAVKGSLTLLSGGIKPGAYDKVSGVYDNIELIKDIIPKGDDLLVKISGVISDLDDIIKTVSQLDAGLTTNPTAELDRIESRLSLIAGLENKYGESVEEILLYFENISSLISELEQYDFTLAEYENAVKEAYDKAEACAKKLRTQRQNGAKKLTESINNEFVFLDMEKVLFKVEFIEKEEIDLNGIDDIVFYIRTNPGEPFKALSTVSSGGELSRIMLSLKTVLSGCDGVGTIVFDEIDSGVSGKTSSKIGISLKTLSKSRQVICVTHSAQVSAIAEHHFKILKSERDGRTYTIVSELNGNDRVNEIARILGGVTITDSVIKTAEELIEQGINN